MVAVDGEPRGGAEPIGTDDGRHRALVTVEQRGPEAGLQLT
jgi:hypothetical protein